MRVICPLSACCSYKKRDQFLALLSDIAVVTKESEPSTISYGWFQSTEDNTEVPNHYLRGFEVYEDESSLVDVHRMSAPYKKMREAVGRDKILEKPTDLRFLQPTGIGFMTRGGMDLFEDDSHLKEDERCLVVVQEIKPKQGLKPKLLAVFEDLAGQVKELEDGTACFWALEYLEEYSDDGIVLVTRFNSDAAYQKHIDRPEMMPIRETLLNSTDSIRTSRWRLSGIGFSGR